ncbi:MAG TPA: hypothetical protein PLV42_00260 [bacterium]|nr:hypothetical protein [bacterium]
MKKFMSILTVAVVALFIAACGDDTNKVPNDNNQPTDDTVTDDTVTDTTVSDDTVTDNAVTDETVTDDTVVDEAVTDETVTDDTVTDNETPDEDTAAAYPFTGKWAMLNFTTSNVTTTVPIIGETKSVSTTSVYALVELTDNGDGTVSAVGTPCDTLIDTGSTLLKVTISDNYIAHLNPMIWDFTTILDRSGVGFDVTSTEILMLNGVNLDNPKTDPLPTDKNDGRIFDQDEDEKPGMTVNCNGTIIGGDGWMATIQRTVNNMVGETKDDTHIEGALIWESEQVVLDASSNTLMSEKTVEPDLAKSGFKMVRLVDQNWTCAEIVANEETLFPQ